MGLADIFLSSKVFKESGLLEDFDDEDESSASEPIPWSDDTIFILYQKFQTIFLF